MNTKEITFEKVYEAEFNAKLAKLIKRANKIGVEPLAWTVTDRGTISKVSASGITYDAPSVTGVLTGTSPQLEGGWRLLGIIKHTEHGNILTGSDERVEGYRNADPNCDHCGLNRRRGTTVVVVNEADEVRQAGLACLKDFLGYHGSPNSLLGYTKETDDLEEWGSYAIGNYGPPTIDVLTVAAAAVRVYGFVPVAAEGRLVSTRQCVNWYFNLPRRKEEADEARLWISLIEVNNADIETAKAVLAWAETVADKGDYLGNVAVALRAPYAERLGLTVSAVGAYLREVEKEAEKAAELTKVKGVVVEGRYEFTGKVLAIKYKENDFGYGYGGTWKVILEVEQADGAIKVWGTRPKGIDVNIGDALTLTATVARSGDDKAFGFFSRPVKASVAQAVAA